MMKAEEALREFASDIVRLVNEFADRAEDDEEYLSRLNILLDEHYYPKEKYDELLKQRDELKEALKRIADPIEYMRQNLKEGESLNGQMAIRISENASYLQDIAKTAINER